MMILDEIVSHNLRELEYRKGSLPLAEVRRLAFEQPPPADFAAVLKGDGVRLIAEIKKASPTRGMIRADLDPVETALIYAGNGASAISVLTERRYFQGSLNYLRDIKKALGQKLPLLRKDFLCDPYEIYESRACGADGILLIVAILKPGDLRGLVKLSQELGMDCLVEAHTEAEVEVALTTEARVIGINNRDLSTFKVDLRTTERLRPLIPPDRIVVSESGIKGRGDIEKLRQLGVDAVLVGESLMETPDVCAKLRELV